MLGNRTDYSVSVVSLSHRTLKKKDIFTFYNIWPINDKMLITISSDLCMTHTKSVKKFVLSSSFIVTSSTQWKCLCTPNSSNIWITSENQFVANSILHKTNRIFYINDKCLFQTVEKNHKLNSKDVRTFIK